MTLTRGPSSPVLENARQVANVGFDAKANVGASERMVGGIVGPALVALGLRRGSLGGLALAAIGGSLVYRSVTGHCSLYDALNLDSNHEGHSVSTMHKGVKVSKSFTVNRSAEDCYTYWRSFQNLPKFMTHLKSVDVADDRHSHWEAHAPLGKTVAWDAEIIEDRPNELISWKSVGDSDVDNAGSVSFKRATGGRGTVVAVELNYEPPAGRVGQAIAWLLGEEPSIQVREDLRRFKQIMETGEIPTVEGQPACR